MGGTGEGDSGWAGGEWGGGVPAGETKPNTGYLKAEMGGACMPNGDMEQRLISLGAHFNLTMKNTHSSLSTHSHTEKGEENETDRAQTRTNWLVGGE